MIFHGSSVCLPEASEEDPARSVVFQPKLPEATGTSDGAFLGFLLVGRGSPEATGESDCQVKKPGQVRDVRCKKQAMFISHDFTKKVGVSKMLISHNFY